MAGASQPRAPAHARGLAASVTVPASISGGVTWIRHRSRRACGPCRRTAASSGTPTPRARTTRLASRGFDFNIGSRREMALWTRDDGVLAYTVEAALVAKPKGTVYVGFDIGNGGTSVARMSERGVTAVGLGARLTGTLHNDRRCHVHLVFQALTAPMASGLVHTALECERSNCARAFPTGTGAAGTGAAGTGVAGMKLLEELVLRAYSNGGQDICRIAHYQTLGNYLFSTCFGSHCLHVAQLAMSTSARQGEGERENRWGSTYPYLRTGGTVEKKWRYIGTTTRWRRLEARLHSARWR
ncbi:hypothetical protein ACQ4PT_005335 [Festuca glaucescens]